MNKSKLLTPNSKLKTQIIVLGIALSIGSNPLYAMDAANPATRDQVIDMTLNGFGGTEQATELEPIRIKVREVISGGDEFLIARALHFYNQRRLAEAKGDLKEIVGLDPKNKAAAAYLANIYSKIESVEKPKEVLEEEKKGIESVDKSHMGGIYGKEEFGGTDGTEKFTTDTAIVTSKINQQGKDLSPNVLVAEGLRMEGALSDYKYTATMNLNYYKKDEGREDLRINNATWWMKNEKVQLIVGDTSSYLSRYILNGVNYRGGNLKLGLYENMFGDVTDNITILYGKVPYFYLTEDEYIYPRDVYGVRNEADIGENWSFNTSFAYILDNRSRITKIDTNDKAKQNAVLGIDQAFRLLPGIWTLYGESAFGYCNDDRSADTKILRSSAHYYVSDINTKKVKLYNSYEWVDPNFRSYAGLTGYVANNINTIDREHILNFIEYNPYDEVEFGAQYSKTRTNLHKKDNTQTIEDNNYKANLKIMPANGLPRFSLRGSIWTSNTAPGAIGSPKDESSWDTVFEIAKKLWETDLSVSYGLRGYSQFINDTNTYGDALEQSFSLSANRKFFDRIELTPTYSFARAHLKKTPNRALYTETVTSHLLGFNMSAGLWDTANLTFDYNFSTTEDFATPSVWGTNNAFTTTFSWPFTTNLGMGKKLVFSPYLSYHYSTGKANFLDRNYFSSKLEGDYYLTPNSKFNLSGEYRDNNSNDPAYVGFADEYRVMVSYKTVNGF